MKKYLYIPFLFFSNLCLGQVNLVINPGFELIYSCPNSYNQLDTAIGWSKPIQGGGHPDLFHKCCTFPLSCGIPFNHNNISYQQTHSGNSYIGIGAMLSDNPDNFRDYIQSKLVKKLSIENEYCIKFYANLSDFSKAFIEKLGVYFDDGSVSAPSFFGLISVMPQVYNTLVPLNDTVNWIKIEGSFVATGNEEYITIGNFFADTASGVGLFGTPTSALSYYFIDDISVIPTNLPAYAGNDTLIQPGDSVFIGRQPEIGLDEDCIWFVNGQPIDTVAGFWVQPDTTTTYILEQTICGNVSWDTVKVIVSGVGIDGYAKDSKEIRLFPNPATNTLNIESTTKFSQMLISDVLGNVVIRQQVYNKTVTIDISGLTKGLYFIKLTTDDGIIVKKFLKE